MTDSVDFVQTRLADTLTVDFNCVNILTESRRNGQNSSTSRSMGLGNALSTVEIVTLDTVTSLIKSIVEGKSRASSAHSINSLESSDTDAGHTGQIQLLVSSASRSANRHLGIVVLGRRTEGTDSLDEVEVGSALADIVDENLVESADRNYFGGDDRSSPDFVALSSFSIGSLQEFKPSDAVARTGVEIIGRIRRANVTDGLDTVIAIVAYASFISIDFIPSADGVVGVEREALSVAHVISDQTNALAEDIVVDLIDRAVDFLRFGISYWGDVGTVRDESSWDAVRSIAQMVGCLLA